MRKPGDASSLTVLSSMATRGLLAELGALHGARTGCAVSIRSLGGVEVARLVRAGEATDVVVLAEPVMARLEAEGHLVAGQCAAIARSGIAAAVRAGAPYPPFDDEAAVRAAMLAADRVAFSTGPSGDHLQALWTGWGIASQMAARAVQAPPGVPVATLLADGRADLGFQQTSELLGQPGIEIIGSLPPAIQATTVFVAGVAARGTGGDAARAFIAFVASHDARASVSRHGMEPP